VVKERKMAIETIIFIKEENENRIYM